MQALVRTSDCIHTCTHPHTCSQHTCSSNAHSHTYALTLTHTISHTSSRTHPHPRFSPLQGVGLRDLRGETTAFLKQTVGLLSTHYPQRSFKIMVLNAPAFFGAAYAMVKGLLNESTRAKIAIVLPAQTATEMLQVSCFVYTVVIHL
jgi:CRAL/TRIO domain